MKVLTTPLKKEILSKFKVGERLLLTGRIFTARDRAHQRLVEMYKKKSSPPISLEGEIIYYCGPNFKKKELGACGPTTSIRMDGYLEPLLKLGVLATIGKGERNSFVKDLCKKYKCVYFLTYAGCGAYLRERVKSSKIVAFKDLGPEAIYEFVVEDFPLIVGIDTEGNAFWERRGDGRKKR